MEVSKKEQDILHSIRIILRANRAIEEALKADMTSYGMRASEFQVLEFLYNRGPHPIQKIGESANLASSSITYVVDKLEEKGLLKRVRSSTDRRVILVELTDSGKELMDDIFPQHLDFIRNIFTTCDDQEIIQLGSLMRKIGYQAADLTKKD